MNQKRNKMEIRKIGPKWGVGWKCFNPKSQIMARIEATQAYKQNGKQ